MFNMKYSFLIVVVILLVASGCFNNNNKTNETTNETVNETTPEKPISKEKIAKNKIVDIKKQLAEATNSYHQKKTSTKHDSKLDKLLEKRNQLQKAFKEELNKNPEFIKLKTRKQNLIKSGKIKVLSFSNEPINQEINQLKNKLKSPKLVDINNEITELKKLIKQEQDSNYSDEYITARNKMLKLKNKGIVNPEYNKAKKEFLEIQEKNESKEIKKN